MPASAFQLEDFTSSPYLQAFLTGGLTGLIRMLEKRPLADDTDAKCVIFLATNAFGITEEQIAATGAYSYSSLRVIRSNNRNSTEKGRRKLSQSLPNLFRQRLRQLQAT